MISFLCKFRPRSVQAKYTDSYKKAVVDAYRSYYDAGNPLLSAELYGISYYFHRKPAQIDADNLSKPIWDALEAILYPNDRLITLRYSGVFYIGETGTIVLPDMRGIPNKVHDDFIEAIDMEDHIIYIEVGLAKTDLYRMGVE